MTPPELRPFQKAGIECFMRRPDKRLLLVHATSAGKTASAIICADSIGAKDLLVVCPAIGRGTWLREFKKWSPLRDPHRVRFGAKRKGLSYEEKLERETAHNADVQVMSYSMLASHDPLGEHTSARWDMVIFDEVHALRDPLSAQSKAARRSRSLGRKFSMLGLTATLLPTELYQIWSPLDTFWPGEWGMPAKEGGISWGFKAKYCEKIITDYGMSFKGSRSPEALEELKLRLAPRIHRVTDAEVMPYLPPLHASALYIDANAPMFETARDWYTNARDQHAGAFQGAVFTFKQDEAYAVARQLEDALKITVPCLTGRMPPDKRDAALQHIRAGKLPLFVGTVESFREQVSLAFCTEALVFDWRATPGAAVQFLGRFPRQDTNDLKKRTHIQYVIYPDDEERAALLLERMECVKGLYAADKRGTQLQDLFFHPMDEQTCDNYFAQMMGGFKPGKLAWAE